jgi:hypothetical protein
MWVLTQKHFATPVPQTKLMPTINVSPHFSLVGRCRYPDAAISARRHNPMYLSMLKHHFSQDPPSEDAECMRAGVDPKITHAL